MSAGVSIVGGCSDCCTCPTATVEWDSRSASVSKSGFVQGYGFTTSPPKRFLTVTGSSNAVKAFDPDADPASNYVATAQYDGTFTLSFGEAVSGTAKSIIFTVCDEYGAGLSCSSSPSICSTALIYPAQVAFLFTLVGGQNVVSESEFKGNPDYANCADPVLVTLSNEYTTAALKTNTIAALSAYDNDWDETAGSYANLSTDELTDSIRESRYRLRFKIPQVNTGKNYRVSWVERFVAEAGVAVSSVEVYARGVYRPTVTLSAPPTGGTQALATAVMSSTGTVSTVPLLNPGLGYIPLITFSGGGGFGAAAIAVINSSGAVTSVIITSAGSGYSTAPTVSFTNVTAPRIRATGTASVSGGLVTGVTVGTAGDFRPTVTVQAATGGGTSSTGWVATLDPTTGQVTGIASGSAGDYRPTIAFTGGAGTGATATCTLDATGGIASVTLTAGGSAYTSEPTLTITPKVTGSTAADLIVHMGSETAKCAVWDGTTLGGKWVKREIVDAGHALTSIEVVHGGTGFTTAPTVTITGGGGTGATATTSVSGGVITAITLGTAGTGFLTNPTITLSGGGGAGGGTVLLAAHFGTETEYADGSQPPGTLPLGYVDGVIRTYPIIGNTGTAPWKYYELAVPASDGTTMVNNVRAVCDGSAC